MSAKYILNFVNIHICIINEYNRIKNKTKMCLKVE